MFLSEEDHTKMLPDVTAISLCGNPYTHENLKPYSDRFRFSAQFSFWTCKYNSESALVSVVCIAPVSEPERS